MDTNLLSMSQQFSGLPMESLIGGPLNAAAKANSAMALTQTRFMLDTCFNMAKEDKDGKTIPTQYEPIMIDMILTRSVISEDKDDPNAGGKVPVGGFTDQYIFRLAETYLNRAEAYWWLGKNDLATEDVNTIRRRVNAPELSSVTLEDILDERARELFLEDHRKTELTRIAFLKAEKGIDGYSLNNFSEKNWYYDRMMEKNNFFATEYYYSTNAFIMKPYHVLWPIPRNAIESNTQGRINQNYGYDGYEDNIPVEELEQRYK